MSPDALGALKTAVAEHVDARAAVLEGLSLKIHGTPELAFAEREAAMAQVAALRAEGVAVTAPAGGLETAFVAEAGTGATLVAILGEYDALPGVGHGCGHNLIGAGAIGAFLALRAVLPAGAGRVRLLGCPAEELGNGKVLLMGAGLFKDVAAALMFHPGDRDILDPLMLALVTLDVTFRGRAAHAAAEPHAGINALDALMLAWSSVSALRQLMRSDARIHGVITEGGLAPNVIPDRTTARFVIRAADNRYLEELRLRVLACFEGAALATGCTLEYAFGETSELVRTNRPLAAAFAANTLRLGRTMKPRRGGETRGSTDLGNVSTLIPSIHPYLAIADEPLPGHSHAFTAASATARAHTTMRLAAKALAMTALDLLTDPALRRDVHKAFDGG